MSNAQPEPWGLPPKPLPDAAPASSGSSVLKLVLIGCGGMMLLMVIICSGVGWYAYRWGMEQVNALSKEYEDRGYTRQMGQIIEVHQSPPQKTVYVCQILRIETEVQGDVAMVCQMAEVNRSIHGRVDFVGQVLKVKQGVVINGDLHIKNGQVVEIQGEVTGTISGNYDVLKYQGKTYARGQYPGPAPLPPPRPAEQEATPAEATPAEATPADPAN